MYYSNIVIYGLQGLVAILVRKLLCFRYNAFIIRGIKILFWRKERLNEIRGFVICDEFRKLSLYG